MSYHITSETAPLKHVLVHTPGVEMTLVAPSDKDELLFDDILHTDRARHEHEILVRVLQCIAGPDSVWQITHLLAECFEQEDARAFYLEQLMQYGQVSYNYLGFKPQFSALTATQLLDFAVTGRAPFAVHARPLPNLLFTRDLCSVVGQHVVLSQSARPARMREALIIETIFRFHPRFSAQSTNILKLPPGVFFEGGDLLVVNDKLVLIGQSERTSLGGVMSVARLLFAHTAVENVVMIGLPHQRSCMHLDTVFTYADKHTCVVFPPIIERDLNNVFQFQRGPADAAIQTQVWPNLQVALNALTGDAHTLIPCGGNDPLAQEREQWTDGANLFAVAPGIVIAYERNERTFEQLAARGFHVVDAQHFLSYYSPESGQGVPGGVPAGAKIAIKLIGHELSRGRGGPRCMTMPIARVC